MKTSPPPSNPQDEPLPKPPKSLLMTYTIGRGEQGVLTFEPYKSHLLPHWRFRTLALAKSSSSTLFSKFLAFYQARDFVGMDMTRKFIQMGMTRSKRYANFKGGRKYDEDGREKEKGKAHKGKEEKEMCSLVFRRDWERCKAHEGYGLLRKEWEREKNDWLKNGMCKADEDVGEGRTHIKEEEEEEGEKPKTKGRKRVKLFK